MNAVEIEARPGLTAMVTGKAAALSTTECRALAVWGTKTVMIHEATDPDTAGYHRPEHLWLFENREPPTATEVWAGSQPINEEWSLRLEHFGLLVGPPEKMDEPCDTLMTTIGLGQMVMVVIHSPNAYPPRPPFESMGGAMVKLWPLPIPIAWPPADELPLPIVQMIAHHFPWITQ
jgi:hypothetical protein